MIWVYPYFRKRPYGSKPSPTWWESHSIFIPFSAGKRRICWDRDILGTLPSPTIRVVPLPRWSWKTWKRLEDENYNPQKFDEYQKCHCFEGTCPFPNYQVLVSMLSVPRRTVSVGHAKLSCLGAAFQNVILMAHGTFPSLAHSQQVHPSGDDVMWG